MANVLDPIIDAEYRKGHGFMGIFVVLVKL